MGNRVFVGVVVMLWAGTMSWLMVARILPPFFHGEPPSHGALLQDEPNCWEIQYGGQKVGYAVSQAVPGDGGTVELHSRLLLDDIEINELAPQWMGTLVKALGKVSLDVRSKFVFDSLKALTGFATKVRVNDLPIVLRVNGQAAGADLKISVQTGDVTQEANIPLPSTSLLSSELIPDPKLLPVYVGRKWQQEFYSPFRPPGSSMEIVQAEVVEEGMIEHRGELIRARRIEYRSLSPAGVAADNTLHATVWVADGGDVIRQEIRLMNAKLRFDRCTEPEMIKMATDLLNIDKVATIAPHRTEPR
jgi:hypothetical protein